MATTHRIEAYGGFRFPPSIMGQIAEAMQSGKMPMHFEHDSTRPVDPTNVVAGTETLDDGHLAAWVEFDVDADLWARREAELLAAGAPGGFSVSFTSPIKDGPETAFVAADASHFDEETIICAAESLAPLGGAKAGLLFQFSYAPIAKVVFELVTNLSIALGPNILAAVIYDAAKKFLAKGKKPGKTVFDFVFRVSPGGSKEVSLHLETDDHEVLLSAVNQIPEIIAKAIATTYAYDIPAGEYREVDSNRTTPPEILEIETGDDTPVD